MRPEPKAAPATRPGPRAVRLAALLLAAAAAQYFWNLATLPPFSGYDDDGHMHYVATLLDEARWPHPREGWSTFHPPLYYALVALASRPGLPAWSPVAIGSVSALPILLVGALAFLVIRRLGYGSAVAGVATALLLFTPCVQIAATMVGNEALGAAFATLALAGLLLLQKDPGDLRRAAVVGVCVGLALSTKASGLMVAAACAAPFLRRDLDRRGVKAAALCGLLALGIAAPTYLRNLELTGSLLPMTRDRSFVALNERWLTIRERRATDYLWLDPSSLLDPVVPDTRAPRNLNPAMTNVWGLAYASTWFDAHAIRVGWIERAQAVAVGRVLLLLGLVPTLLMLTGFALALREWWTRGGAARDAPLALASLTGLASFVAFTARVPTSAAVKGAYLLPLALPAAVFFARGVDGLAASPRRIALAVSAAAALACAVAFTNGVLLPLHQDERAPASDPGIAAVGRALDAASAGRWRGIRVRRAPDQRIVWELHAFAYSPIRPAQLSAWCRYLSDAMRRELPERRWRAVVLQGEGQPSLACAS